MRHSGNDAPPARMGGGHRTGGGKEKRKTVGDRDGNGNAGALGHEGINGRVGAGSRDPCNIGAMDLPGSGERRRIEGQGLKHSASIFGDGLGKILGRAADVETLIGRKTDAASTGSEGKNVGRRRGLGAPQRKS